MPLSRRQIQALLVTVSLLALAVLIAIGTL
jgi:hypothetical protein